MTDLVASVVIKAIDQMTAPLVEIKKTISQVSSAATRANKKLAETAQKVTEPVKKTTEAIKKTTEATNKTTEAIKKTNREVTGGSRKIREHVSQVTRAVSSANRKLAESSRKLSASVKQTSERLKKQRQDLMGQIPSIAGMAASFALPIKAAIEFESVMADVKKVVNFDTPQEFKQMSQDIVEMSKKIPMSVEGLGSIAAAAGQAGIARGDILKLTEQAAKMGVAFDISGEVAGKSMTGLMSLFHRNVDGAVELADAFNFLGDNMDLAAKDLVEIANRSGSVADQYHMSGENLAAFGATLLHFKTPVETTGTAMNALLNKFGALNVQTPAFKKISRVTGIHC